MELAGPRYFEPPVLGDDVAFLSASRHVPSSVRSKTKLKERLLDQKRWLTARSFALTMAPLRPARSTS